MATQTALPGTGSGPAGGGEAVTGVSEAEATAPVVVAPGSPAEALALEAVPVAPDSEVAVELGLGGLGGLGNGSANGNGHGPVGVVTVTDAVASPTPALASPPPSASVAAAAPAPGPPSGSPTVQPLDAELRDLRKEISDSRALIIKTHNLIGQVGVDVKQVSRRQDRYERGLSLNSFVAYVLFTLLLGGAFFLLYRSRAERLVVERDAALQSRATERAERDQLAAAAEARTRGEDRARRFHELIAAGASKRSEVIAQYPEVAREALSPVEAAVFRDAVAKARTEIAGAGYAAGVEAIQAQQWKRAAQEFKRAMPYEPEGPRAVQMRYYYGLALHKQGDFQEAAHQLEAALEGGVDRNVGGDIEFYLANALDMLRQLDRAKALYERYLATHAQGALAIVARRRLDAIRATNAAAAKPGVPGGP